MGRGKCQTIWSQDIDFFLHVIGGSPEGKYPGSALKILQHVEQEVSVAKSHLDKAMA